MAGSRVTPAEIVEMHRLYAQLGNYAADVAFNLDIAAGPGVVTVTAKLEDGLELVIYETTLPVGSQQSVSFTAYLQTAGQYECTVYVDGVVVRSGLIGLEYRR